MFTTNITFSKKVFFYLDSYNLMKISGFQLLKLYSFQLLITDFMQKFFLLAETFFFTFVGYS